jgi:hypothetical protein
MSYVINDLSQQIRDELSDRFTQELSLYFQQLGSKLIDFALAFGFDKKIEKNDYKQKGISRAFHSFLFAGIQPKDMSDIIVK